MSHRVMSLKQVAPPVIAEIDRALGRPDYVREEHRSKRPFWLRAGALARKELLDLFNDRGHVVVVPWPMIAAVELDKTSAGDVPRQVTSVLDPDERILTPVEDQRRRSDRAKNAANVHLGVHP